MVYFEETVTREETVQMIVETMRKVSAEVSQKLIFIGLATLMYVLPIPQLVLPYVYRGDVQTTILRLFLIYFSVIVAIEAANRRIDFRKRAVVGICLLGLVIVGLCSVAVSEDWVMALYGQRGREGWFTLVSYYMIFFATTLLRDEKYCRHLLHLFLVFGSIVAVLGFIQFTEIYEFGPYFPGMALAPMHNPNFYGAFAVLFTGVAIGGFFVYEKNLNATHLFAKQNRWIWYGFVLLGYSACIFAGSSLVYVGLIMMLLLYLVLEIVTKRRRFLSFAALLGGLALVIFVFDMIQGGNVTREITSVGTQIKAEGSVFGDSVGTSRMYTWKRTIRLLPQYFWFGCGIEQLGIISQRIYGPEDPYPFDKAHNEYLNLWVTEGVFAIVFYLVFLFALFLPRVMRFVKRQEEVSENVTRDVLSRIALFAFFGYIAQAFFNISVIQVAPYFWVICGFLFRESSGQGLVQKGKKNRIGKGQ